MGITVTLSGADRVRNAIRALAQIAPDRLKAAVAESTINIHREAREAVPVDVGFLRSSIVFEVLTNGGGITGEVRVQSNYGVYVEFGTKPHFPPIAPLEEWARRHGMPPGTGFLIARKISQVGTPAHPFLFPAAQRERSRFADNVRAALLDAIRSAKTS